MTWLTAPPNSPDSSIRCLKACCLHLCSSHHIHPRQYWILCWIIWAVLAGDLQGSRHHSCVWGDHIPDHVSNILADQDDSNVITCSKFPICLLNLSSCGLGVHKQIISPPPYIQVAHTRQQKPCHSVLIPNYSNESPFRRHVSPLFALNCLYESCCVVI